jgi:hypothetical protein
MRRFFILHNSSLWINALLKSSPLTLPLVAGHRLCHAHIIPLWDANTLTGTSRNPVRGLLQGPA